MAAESFLEIEAKFAVDLSTEVPDLTAADGIESISSQEQHELSAVYYDTADLRLTREKITLRRRTGGNDAGWHLKLPGTHGRKEIRAELGPEVPAGEPAEVPKDLMAEIRSLVRAVPLRPIAQIDNNRTVITVANAAGTDIIEFCDDHVTARSFLPTGKEIRWREWEIELTQDGLAEANAMELLSNAAGTLRAAGAFPSSSPSKLSTALGDSIQYAPLPPSMQESTVEPDTPAAAVVEALRANRDKLVEYDPRVRADEWDSVHQMRVATRELRSHLQTFHGIVEGPEIAEIESELKALAGLLGVARDAEVVEERWQKLLSTEDSDALDDVAREHISHDMGVEYRRAHRHIIGALNSERYLNLLESLDALLLNPPVKEVKVEDARVEAPAEESSDSTVGTESAETAESAESAESTESAADAQAVESAEVAETAPADDAAAAAPAAELDPEAAAKAAEKAERKARKAALKEMDAVMAAHLGEAYEKLVKRHNKAVDNWDNEELSLHEREEYFHDMRKAAKKLRYAAEAAGSATRLETGALYRACKEMQSVLGDFQDSVTSRDKLKELAAAAHARGEDTFAYGLLYQRERFIGLQALDDYMDSFVGIKAAFKPLRKKIK